MMARTTKDDVVKHFAENVNGVATGVYGFVDDELDARMLIADDSASLATFIENCDSNAVWSGDNSGHGLSDRQYDLEWVGRPEGIDGDVVLKTRDFFDAFGKARDEDIEAVSGQRGGVMDSIDNIDLSDFESKIRWISSLPGRVDSLRLLRGESNFARRRVRSKAPVEAVCLGIPMTASWSVDADAIMARAAVAICAAEILQDYGFAVEIWAFAYSRDLFRSGPSNGLAAVRLKAADDPFNEAEITSGASSWFYRTAFFSMWGAMGRGDVNGGLGYPEALSKEKRKAVARCLGLHKAHIMRGIPPGSYSKSQAIKDAIEDVIEALDHWVGDDSEGGDY